MENRESDGAWISMASAGWGDATTNQKSAYTLGYG